MEKEKIPAENETIKAVRKARLFEKNISKKGRFSMAPSRWGNVTTEILFLILIFFMNYQLVYPFINTPSQLIPFSGPVIPLLAKIQGYFGVPLANSLQTINLIAILFFPASFYLFLKAVSSRKLTAVIAVLASSLPFYPFAKTRILSAALGGDGPHIVSLTLIPFAIYTLLVFLRVGGIRNILMSSITAALVALTSPFGFFTYIIFALISVFSEILLGQGRLKLIRFIVVLILAGGLNSFWYNPAFFVWMVVGPMGVEIREMLYRFIPISFFALPILATFGYLLFDRKPHLQSVFIASFYSISFAMIVLAGGGFIPSHPNRYAPEFGISLSLFIAVLIVKLADSLKFGTLSGFHPLNLSSAAASTILLAVTIAIISLLIIIGRGNLSTQTNNVLGVWTGVERGDIWEARDRFSGIPSVLGYTITGTTVFGMVFMGISNKNKLVK